MNILDLYYKRYMIKLTILDFIAKAKKIHGDKYDYSVAKYIGCDNKLRIICPIHGEFEQTPHNHLYRRQGCNPCGYIKSSISLRYSVEDFIEKAKKIHGSKYDYSLVSYSTIIQKIKIICPIHGEFEQRAGNHLRGNTCGKCNGLHQTTNDFINNAKVIHGDKYDYSLVEYKNRKTKVKIICSEHGEFEQAPFGHLYGQNCPKCTGKIKLTNNEFINKAKLVHGDKYDYSLVEYKNTKTKVKIICQIHGEFKQSPNMHLRNNGCPICKESRGEMKVRKFLEENNISYIPQKKFKNCMHKQQLPFDFYLPDSNTCIEFDGKQHFEPNTRFGGMKGFIAIQQSDTTKNNFCIKNNINLLRINYNDDIQTILENFLIKKKHSSIDLNETLGTRS